MSEFDDSDIFGALDVMTPLLRQRQQALEAKHQRRLKRRNDSKAYSSIVGMMVSIVAMALLLSTLPWVSLLLSILTIAFGARFLRACHLEEKRLNPPREVVTVVAAPEPDWYDAAQAAGLFKPLEIEVGEVDPGFFHRDNETFLAELAEELLTPEERLAREVEAAHVEALEIESSRNKPTVVVPLLRANTSRASGLTHNGHVADVNGYNIARFAQYDRRRSCNYIDLRSLSGRVQRVYFAPGTPYSSLSDGVVEMLREMNAEDREHDYERDVVQLYGDNTPIVQNVYTGTGVAL